MAQELSEKAKILIFEIRYAFGKAVELGSSIVKLAKEVIEEESARFENEKAKSRRTKEEFEAAFKAWKSARDASN